VGTGYNGLRIGSMGGGSCEDDYEPSGSIKSGEFLDQFSDHQVFKDSVPWNWETRFLEKKRYARY
jgi:hypothetical protein